MSHRHQWGNWVRYDCFRDETATCKGRHRHRSCVCGAAQSPNGRIIRARVNQGIRHKRTK